MRPRILGPLNEVGQLDFSRHGLIPRIEFVEDRTSDELSSDLTRTQPKLTRNDLPSLPQPTLDVSTCSHFPQIGLRPIFPLARILGPASSKPETSLGSARFKSELSKTSFKFECESWAKAVA